MVAVKNQASRTSGFALIVVLSTLAILTLLFSISSRLSLAHIQTQDAEVTLAMRYAKGVTLMESVSGVLAEAREGGQYQVTLADTTHDVWAVDVGGLVDLNTASQPLLQTYLQAIGMTEDEIARFREWRQTPHRLVRVGDLLRISGARSVNRTLLLGTSTVYSGRQGIALDQAPQALRNLLADQWKEQWATPASGVNFVVSKQLDSARVRLGVVHVRPDNQGKIITIF